MTLPDREAILRRATRQTVLDAVRAADGPLSMADLEDYAGQIHREHVGDVEAAVEWLESRGRVERANGRIEWVADGE